jgi:hypothetical protein
MHSKCYTRKSIDSQIRLKPAVIAPFETADVYRHTDISARYVVVDSIRARTNGRDPWMSFRDGGELWQVV